MKHSPRLSEWALDLLWRLMSLVHDVVVTLSVMDCLYPRDPPQPVREKKIASQDSEHAGLKKANTIWFCLVKSERKVAIRGEGGPSRSPRGGRGVSLITS